MLYQNSIRLYKLFPTYRNASIIASLSLAL